MSNPNFIPVPPIMYCLSDIPGSNSNTAQAQRNIANFARAGIDFVSADTGLYLGWHKRSPFDPEALKEEIAGVLEANPNAKIYLRLHVNPPYWWMRDHPEEQIMYRTPYGDNYGTDDGEQDRLIRGDAEGRIRVSLASELWKKEAGECLAAFCDAVKGTPEGNALAGVQVACGINGEWHNWGVDVGKPIRARFVRFLREKYGTEEALRAAWHNDTVTFENAHFRPEPFRPGDVGDFRDPQKSRDTMDAQECIQTSTAEAILYFCKIVKEHLPETQTGSFYAYYLGTGGNNMTISGHIMIEKFIQAHKEGYFDFFCGPFCYMQNREARGIPMQRALLESHRLNGILWLTEMDQHPAGTEKYHGGDPARFDETVSVLRRNTFQTLLAGEGFWYYDHRIIPRLLPPDSKNSSAGSIYRKKGWWDKPELMDEIAKIYRIAKKYVTADLSQNKPLSDVLLVYDTKSFYCRAKNTDKDYVLHEAVARTGVAFDNIYLHDLPKAELSRYKCVIFVNDTMITPQEREQIHALTKGITCVWFPESGYCDGETLSEENIRATVADGILLESRLVTAEQMKAIFQAAGCHIWTESGDPVMAGCGLFLINAPDGGEKTLTFPNGRQIHETLPAWTTAVYDVATGERLL